MGNTELNGTARYGTVEQKIRSIVESLEGVAYMFKNWSQANDEIDHIDGPTIIYVLPPSGDLDFDYSQVRDYPQSQIAFVASTEFDFEGEEQIEGRLSHRVLYDYFDQNVTGIVITPPLIEEEGVIICTDEHRSEDESEGE